MASLQSFDRRRINGPEKSTPPTYEEAEIDGVDESHAHMRQGRKPAEIRRIFLRPGIVSQANGSAYIEVEKTKVACAVYGPRQEKGAPYNEKGNLNVQVKFAPFASVKRKAPLRDAEDRSLSTHVAQALLPALRLELYPKSSIDVFVTILEHDGLDACVAACTIAASTAVADAGVEMLGLVVSCTAARVRQETWLDPAAKEVLSSQGLLGLACMPALGSLTNVWQSGELTLDEIDEVISQCLDRCNDIHRAISTALLGSAKARMNKKQTS